MVAPDEVSTLTSSADVWQFSLCLLLLFSRKIESLKAKGVELGDGGGEHM